MLVKKIYALTFEPIGGVGGPFSNIMAGYDPGGTLEKFFTILLGFLTTIGSIMFLIYFVVGALNWITSGGDREKIAKAQHYMSNAIIGLILVILAWSITGIIGLALGFNILDLAASIGKIYK